MAVGRGVTAGVPVRRGVAAADVATGQAEPEVEPGGTRGQAFLASRGARGHGAYEGEVGVGPYGHGRSSFPGRSAAGDRLLHPSPQGRGRCGPRLPGDGLSLVEDQQRRYRLDLEALRSEEHTSELQSRETLVC